MGVVRTRHRQGGDQCFVETRLEDVVVGLCLCSAYSGPVDELHDWCGRAGWQHAVPLLLAAGVLLAPRSHAPRGVVQPVRMRVWRNTSPATWPWILAVAGAVCLTWASFCYTSSVVVWAAVPRHFLPSLFSILPMPGHFVRVQGWCGAHVDVVQQRQGIQLLGLSHLVMALFPCPCSFMPCGRRVALLDRGMATPCRLCSRFCAQQHTYSDAGFTSEAPAFDTHMGALQVMQQEGTFGGFTAYSRLFCMTAAASSCCFAVL